MRLAFVDMLFSWPPIGGADTDLFHTISGLQALGHEVRLFAAKNTQSRERPGFEPGDLPFPATRLDFAPASINRRDMPDRFRAAVDAWRPDAVFMGFGYFLKPFVAAALAHYPMAARLYAYELACPSDLRLFRDGRTCADSYFSNPNECRRCALQAMAAEIKNGHLLAWSHEYLAARACMPGYYRRLLDFVRQCRAVIVYNQLQRRHLMPYHDNVRVIPGGVTFADFPELPVPAKKRGQKTVILMSGRAEDPAKGLQTLLEAGDRLARERGDFEIRVTLNQPAGDRPWLKALGWQDHDGIHRLYRDADVCVVPSVWEEPFGMVAVEAMASARPVVAARVGGLQEIVLHEETGLLFDPGDSAACAQTLAKLLDDPRLRRTMGEAGRARARECYDWPRIIEHHYPQLLEDLAAPQPAINHGGRAE